MLDNGVSLLAKKASIVCGAVGNQCISSLGAINVDVYIYHEQLNEYIIVNLNLNILPNLPCEMIIGNSDVKTHDLSVVCRSQFAHVPQAKRPPPCSAATITERPVTRITYPGSNKRDASKIVDQPRALSSGSGHEPLSDRHHKNSAIAHDQAQFCLANADFLEHTERINMVKTMQELIGVEEEADELSKAMSTDPKHAIPQHLYENTTDNEIEDHIKSIQVGLFEERHRDLFNKYRDLFSTAVRPEPALLEPMSLDVDVPKWQVAKNSLPARKQSDMKQTEIHKQVNQLLELNVVQKTRANHFSQVLLAPKPNNKWRLCVDYKNLNECTKSPGYPIPNIKEMIDRIGSKRPKYMAVIDLTAGYHQAPLAKDSMIFTAFTCFMGLFIWQRVPFGLKGAPGYFQQVMATIVLLGLLYYICENYLDDVFVSGNTEDEYFHNLEEVFKRFDKHKLTIHPGKLRCGLTEVEYVGHTISEAGISHNRSRIDKVLQIQPPSTQGGLKSFVGVCEYFHDHIEHCADYLRPLRKLIEPYNKTKALHWDQDSLAAFQLMKDKINECPKLYFVDTNANIYLHTDASKYGIGAYLYQVIDGKEQPISYMSRALSKTEINWSTTDKEAYAIVFALYKFEHLLRDINFTIRTDHKNLTYMVDSKSERVNRWRDYLQRFHGDVMHIPGKDNVLADAFSRLVELDQETINYITENFITDDSAADIEHLYALTKSDIRIPNELYEPLAKVHNTNVGHHGVEKTHQRLLSSLPKELLKKYPNLRPIIRRFIQKCPCCQKMSTLRIPIHTHKYTLAAYAPMYKVCMDTINLDNEDIYGNKYIIVLIDCFSRWVELYAMPDLTALSAAQALIAWCGTFGVPNELHTDLGTQFANEAFREMEQLMGFTHTFNISPYSKEENGLVERANKEVMRHLRAYVFDKNLISDWSINLPLIKRIINSSQHEAIGCSPADLIFGKSINLDWNIIVPRSAQTVNTTTSEWMDKKLTIQQAIVTRAEQLQRERDERHMLTQQPRLSEFKVGSYVLQRYPESNLRGSAPSKLLTHLRGPLKIVKRLEKDNYVLEDLTLGTESHCHASRLVPFYYDARYVDPRDISNRDKQLNEIVKVLQHKGQRAKPTSLTFLVRWAPQLGVQVPDTWEAYADIKNTEALHNYLLNNKMKTLIPAVYRSDYK